MLCLLFSTAKNQLEFCCHMLRGTIDPKEPPVYEYVKFIGNFKALNTGECEICSGSSLSSHAALFSLFLCPTINRVAWSWERQLKLLLEIGSRALLSRLGFHARPAALNNPNVAYFRYRSLGVELAFTSTTAYCRH